MERFTFLLVRAVTPTMFVVGVSRALLSKTAILDFHLLQNQATGPLGRPFWQVAPSNPAERWNDPSTKSGVIDLCT